MAPRRLPSARPALPRPTCSQARGRGAWPKRRSEPGFQLCSAPPRPALAAGRPPPRPPLAQGGRAAQTAQSSSGAFPRLMQACRAVRAEPGSNPGLASRRPPSVTVLRTASKPTLESLKYKHGRSQILGKCKSHIQDLSGPTPPLLLASFMKQLVSRSLGGPGRRCVGWELRGLSRSSFPWTWSKRSVTAQMGDPVSDTDTPLCSL